MNLSLFEILVLVMLVLPLAIWLLRRSRKGAQDDPKSAFRAPSPASPARGEPAAVADSASFEPVLREGCTESIRWKAEIQMTPETEDGVATRRIRRQYTHWSSSSRGLQAGRFLVIMSLPEGAQAPVVPEKPATGMLASLARKAAATIFSVYVSGYFGGRHTALVDLTQADPVHAGPGFAAFTNDVELARRFLDDDTRALLRAAAGVEQVRGNSSSKGLGVLLAPDGVVLGAQVALTTPERLDPFVLVGVRLAQRLETLLSPQTQ